MLHLCPIQSGFDIISTPGGVVNGFLSILQRKPLAFSFLWGSQTFDHFSGADQRPSRGRSAYAPFLPDEKWGKESLRAFPPKNLPGVPGWSCVKSMVGPSPLLWLLALPPHQATLVNWPYSQVVSTAGPT